MTKATGFLGTTSETRTYDALNRVLTNSDNDYMLSYEYAEIGLTSQVRKETQEYVGPPAQALSFTKTYDSRGNITGEVYPSGASLTLTLAFNGINQLTSITDGTNTISSYTYVGLRRKKITFQNGTTQTNSYTGFRSEVETIHHESSTPTTIVRLDYGYNKVHDRTYERFGASGASGDAFEYDNMRRLKKMWQGSSNPSSPSGNSYLKTIEYNYDDDGNRTSVVTTPNGGSASTVSYSTNNLNQYTSVGGTTQTHDANGNLTKNGTLKFAYNYMNLIVEVRKQSDSSIVASYKYDPLGRRVEKDVGGTVERYFMCTRESGGAVGNLANVMCTYDGSGNWQQSFVHHGAVDVVAMLEQADVLDYDADGNTSELTRSFYHLNSLGSVMEITDLSEVNVASYRYDSYGQVTITRGGVAQSFDPLGQHWGFTGRFHDAESGLIYYRARYYDPAVGRFLQRDPLGVAVGPNLFEYAVSSPANFRDPTGLTGLLHDEYDGKYPFVEDVKLVGPGIYGPPIVSGGMVAHHVRWEARDHNGQTFSGVVLVTVTFATHKEAQDFAEATPPPPPTDEEIQERLDEIKKRRGEIEKEMKPLEEIAKESQKNVRDFENICFDDGELGWHKSGARWLNAGVIKDMEALEAEDEALAAEELALGNEQRARKKKKASKKR